MILTLLLSALEKIIAQALKADPDAADQIAQLDNQVFEIHCDDWNIQFYIICIHRELQFERKTQRKPNTIIRGTLNHFLHVFMKGATTNTLFEYPIDIDGNIHNIEVMRDAFKNIDLDLEEKLSHYVGDQLAHKIFSQAKKAKKTLKNTSEKLVSQTESYIYFESKLLPTRKQVEEFYNDIAILRDDVARLEARINASLI